MAPLSRVEQTSKADDVENFFAVFDADQG